MPSVLIIEDEHALAAAVSTLVRRLGGEPSVAASGQSALDKLSKKNFDLAILDIGLPDMSGIEVLKRLQAIERPPPVLVVTAHGTLENALEAKRLGARDYFLKPLDLAEFSQSVRSFLAACSNAGEKKSTESQPGGSLMIGAAPVMQRTYAAIAAACGSEAPVLISGPPGSGKSLAARVIHSNSSRSSGPFVVFRSDEWPADQLEAVLLGSDSNEGLFARAKGGTILLDEISRLPPCLQAALERRLGSEPQADQPRILAETSHDILALARSGQYREDLCYRLKVLEVSLPPLRDRTEDIPAVAAFFISQAAGASRQAQVSEDALRSLKAHSWPGNVREFRHAMEHAAAVCTGPAVLPRHLPETISRDADALAVSPSHLDQALKTALAHWLDQRLTCAEDQLPAYDQIAGQIEGMLLRLLLPKFGDKPTRLAAALRMNRATLRRKCRELPGDRPGSLDD